MVENKTEQDYLELAQASKEKFDEMDLKIKKMNQKMSIFKKNVLSSYFLTKKLDELMDEIDYPDMYKNIITYLVEQIKNDLAMSIFETTIVDINLEELDDLVDIFET